MDPFSYLVVLTSIVLGLAVTRVIGGIGNIIQTRRRRKPYWVHCVWMLNLFLTITIVWCVSYRWRNQEQWTFFLFLWLLLTLNAAGSVGDFYVIIRLLFAPTPLLVHDYGDGMTWYRGI